jgi:hypothetical protein
MELSVGSQAYPVSIEHMPMQFSSAAGNAVNFGLSNYLDIKLVPLCFGGRSPPPLAGVGAATGAC